MLCSVNRLQAVRLTQRTAASRRITVCVRATADEKPAEKARDNGLGKGKLVKSMAAAAEISEDKAEKAFEALFGTIEEKLVAGDKVTIFGFGCFEQRERAERSGRNPSTGESITIPAGKTAVFKASRILKDRINGIAPPPKPKAEAPAKEAKPKATKPKAAKPKAAKPKEAKPKAAKSEAEATKDAEAPAADKKAAPKPRPSPKSPKE